MRAQDWLNQKYPKEKRGDTPKINIPAEKLSERLSGPLDLSDFPNLTELDCSNNHLTTLNLSRETRLTELVCNNNQLNTLNLIHQIHLTKLDCSNNQLRELNLDNCTQLTKLDCSNNQLVELNLDNCTQLTKLDCSRNQLANLNLTNDYPQLTELDCSSNHLTTLNLKNQTRLTYLDCSQNQLTSLALFPNNQLGELDCRNNPLLDSDFLLALNPNYQNRLTRLLNPNYQNQLTRLELDANVKRELFKHRRIWEREIIPGRKEGLQSLTNQVSILTLLARWQAKEKESNVQNLSRPSSSLERARLIEFNSAQLTQYLSSLSREQLTQFLNTRVNNNQVSELLNKFEAAQGLLTLASGRDGNALEVVQAQRDLQSVKEDLAKVISPEEMKALEQVYQKENDQLVAQIQQPGPSNRH